MISPNIEPSDPAGVGEGTFLVTYTPTEAGVFLLVVFYIGPVSMVFSYIGVYTVLVQIAGVSVPTVATITIEPGKADPSASAPTVAPPGGSNGVAYNVVIQLTDSYANDHDNGGYHLFVSLDDNYQTIVRGSVVDGADGTYTTSVTSASGAQDYTFNILVAGGTLINSCSAEPNLLSR